MIKKLQAFFGFLTDFYKSRGLLINLSKNDIKSRYAGSFFGIIWAFIQPLVTIMVFWFVFQIGFRNPPVDNIEFILWFICAYIPWIYCNDGIMSSSGCLYEYAYLVKKVRFRTSALPIVKIISATFIHLFFIVFIYIMFLIYGYSFSPSWLQAFYYSFCLFCLLVGIAWLVSSISVFFKDFTQIINIILQIGFWLTPIFWAPESMSENILRVFKFNPLYYVTQGYRDSFITGIAFWERGPIGIYYWAVTAMVFVLGAVVYQRLRPHFADIL